MRKKIMLALSSSALAINLFLPNVHAESAITEMKDVVVTINGVGVNFDVPPAMKDDRTLVPLRAIFEAMGAAVQWDSNNQTVSATKNEKSINLVINSNMAQINETAAKLDVPPTIYKGRTLVPLRFIGEAFDGTVTWDSVTKQVIITMPESESTIISINSPIYLNNKKLDFGTFTPIIKNNITYIPLESILANLSNEIYWEQRGEDIYLQLDGANLNLSIDKNYATVDGQRVEMAQPLIQYEGQVLAPTNAIAKVLGGYSHYVAETNEIFIYINRAKFTHEFLKKEPFVFSKPTNVASTKFIGNRRIMVCDNPENLNDRTLPSDSVTLWEDEVHAGDSSVDHRIFGWHISELDQTANIGITIENLSSTNEIEVVGLKGTNRQTSNGWVNYDVGLPLAENVLSGKVTSVKMNSPLVKTGQTTLMKSFEINKNNTIGFQYDFSVKKKSGTGELNYKIRTVISKNGADLTTIKSDPVEIDQTALHPRGVWSSSELVTELPPYEVESEETAFQISNGATDNLMSAENGIGEQSKMIKNPGHFGAIYKVKIPIINKTGESKTVRVRFGARGGIYNGAVKVDGNVYLVPTLKPMTEVANIFDYVAEKESGMIELEIMHAGGSALPLAIDLITVEEASQSLQDSQDTQSLQNLENVKENDQ